MQRVPQLEALHVQSFCNEVTGDARPQLVACRPRYDRPAKECFPIVKEQIATYGGSMAIGWAIWEWPGVFIEAEFHATWASPEGTLIDLNPRASFISSIVFLPDPLRRYEGKQIDNIRKPLIRDNDLIRFLFIFRRQFEIVNRGDLASQHGVISLPPKAMKEYQALQNEGARLERRLQKRYGDRS
jgi:hypothetical protein